MKLMQQIRPRVKLFKMMTLRYPKSDHFLATSIYSLNEHYGIQQIPRVRLGYPGKRITFTLRYPKNDNLLVMSISVKRRLSGLTK